MSNINGKINLMQLKAVRMTMKGKTGPLDCVVLPIEANSLFVGDKGIYLDIIAFEITNKKGESKDTHIVKQSLSKEIFEKMTDEQKKDMPIIGNLRVWGEYTEPEPESDMQPRSETDDLPFKRQRSITKTITKK
ncbi:MAG: hypothetical protein ABFD79_18365 [Phycisphaerales bacterium]